LSNKVLDFLIAEINKKVNRSDGLLPSCEIRVTPGRFKKYLSASLLEQQKAHEELDALSRAVTGLKVEYPATSFNEEKRIAWIEIADSRQLLRHLGIPVMADKHQRAAKRLADAPLALPTWAEELKLTCSRLWFEGKMFAGYNPDDCRKVLDAFRFIDHCEGPDFKSTDIRTVSAALYHDSKRLDGLGSIIAKLYREQVPEALRTAKPDEVLAFIGVHRFPPVLSVSGPVDLVTKRGVVSASACWPYLGVPPDGVEQITVTKQPSYVLFIENKTTFERYVRQIDDGGLVLYTNGFPSRKWQGVFKQLDRNIAADVPFYHWGDLDVGGCRILCFIQSLLERDLQPHMMTPFPADFHAENKDGRQIAIADIKLVLAYQKSAGIQALVAELETLEQSAGTITWIEQEYLDLRSPSV